MKPSAAPGSTHAHRPAAAPFGLRAGPRARAARAALCALVLLLATGGLVRAQPTPAADAPEPGELAPLRPDPVTLAAEPDLLDPVYWVERMEAALLPRASLRSAFSLRSTRPASPTVEYLGRLVRVEGPRSIRTVLRIERPVDARQIVRVESRSDGSAERVLYLPSGEPVSIVVSPFDPVLGSAFTWEDLGFVPLDHREKSSVELEGGPGGSTVRLVTGPHGPYGRVVTRLDRKSALPIDVEFHDRKGTPVRRVRYYDVAKKGVYSFPLRIEAHDLRSGAKARWRFADVLIGPTVYEYELRDTHLRRSIRDLASW